MTDCTSFSGFYALFQGPGGEGRGMFGKMKGDIDKDGRCRAVFSSVMQFYYALFHLT